MTIYQGDCCPDRVVALGSRLVQHSSASAAPGADGPKHQSVIRWLVVLASCWLLIGAAGASWLFVLSTAPAGDAGVADPFAGPPDPPAWTGISPNAGSQID